MSTKGSNIYGVIGDPIEHSLSPQMHNAAFKKLGLNCIYLPFRVTQRNLKSAMMGMRALNIRGFNVVLPHKTAIIKFLDELDEAAQEVGAVNTILNDEGRLIGYNTDGSGAAMALEEQDVDPSDKRIILIGAGGAARAIAFTLARGARSIFVLNRTQHRALKLAKDIERRIGKKILTRSLTRNSLLEALQDADILINATSVGMYPKTKQTVATRKILHSGMVVFDIVYNPVKTLLLSEAEAAGAKTITGVGMLVHQGAEAFKIWTNHSPPVEVMRRAVMKGLSGR